MIDPNSANFSAFPPTYREEEGEIVPDYRPGNGNQPQKFRDKTAEFDGEDIENITSYKAYLPFQESELRPEDLLSNFREGIKSKKVRDDQIREAVSPTTVRSVKPFRE